MIFPVTINGIDFKTNDFTAQLRKVQIGDETTTLDGITHIESSAVKRFLCMALTDVKASVGASLLSSVLSKKYTTIKYIDPVSNAQETRVFILQNDIDVPVKLWKNGKQYYSSIYLEFLEKGAE